MSEYLTTRAVAERLGFAPDTVLRWARDGKIPAHKMGGRARFIPAELAAWETENKMGATSEEGVANPVGCAQATEPTRGHNAGVANPAATAARTEEEHHAR
jgi:excisionase family DNA binding protein